MFDHGAQLAQRLVADGETVLDVPPKLATRARMFDQGHGRKNDPGDAHTVGVVAIRTKQLRHVEVEGKMVAIRLMSERRRKLVRSRTETVSRLHQLLMELIPAGGQRNLTAAKAKAHLAVVRPRDIADRTRRAWLGMLLLTARAPSKKTIASQASPSAPAATLWLPRKRGRREVVLQLVRGRRLPDPGASRLATVPRLPPSARR